MSGRKFDIAVKRAERFPMVFAGFCFVGKGKLHFVAEKPRSAQNITLPHLINYCKKLLPDHLIFQQDGAPANTAEISPRMD